MNKISSIIKYLKNNETKLLILLFIVTLFLRSLYVYIDYTNNNTTKWCDDWEYLLMGVSIFEGDWEPTLPRGEQMQVAPLLPVIVAYSFKVFGITYIPIFILNIVLTSLLIPLLYMIGKEVFSRKIGLFLAIWGILYVDFYKYSPNILKESIVFFLLPLTIYFLIKTIKYKYKFINILILSVSFSVLIHADERYFLYFPLIILVILFQRTVNFKKVLKPAFQFFGIVLLIMFPWLIRNYIVFEQVVILSPRTTAFTSKLWGDNISGVTFSDEKAKQKAIERRYNDAIEIGKKYNIKPYIFGKYESYYRAFINYWQPAYFGPTFFQDGLRFHIWSFKHNLSGILFYGIFLPFYIIGLYLLIKQKYNFGIVISLIPIIHSLLHTYMIMPLERYRSPVVFIIVLIALYIIFKISRSIKNKFRLTIK